MFIICSWELIFQIIGISRILCLPDRSFQELHFEFLRSIVAQSDQKIWKFTSTFWCGWMPIFPNLQIWISDQSISKWHISWTNKATESSKSREHSLFHTIFETAKARFSVFSSKCKKSMAKKTRFIFVTVRWCHR